MSESKPSQPSRSEFLDRIRAFLTILVVLHHSVIMFGGPGGWYFRYETPEGFEEILFATICSVNQAFFMGFFFLLAGYFTPRSLERKGIAAFVGDRLLRLGIPILIYGFLLGPLTIALASTADGENFTSNFLDRLARASFNIGPLWFAEALLLFSACFIALHLAGFRAQPDSRTPTDKTLWISALLTGVAAILIRLAVPVGAEVWNMQLGYFASYIVLFLTGCYLAKTKFLEEVPAALARRWGWIAFGVTPTFFIYALVSGALTGGKFDTTGGWNSPSIAYALWEPVIAWGIILWLLYWFRESKRPSKLLSTVAPKAFGIFILHPPAVVGIGLLVHSLKLPASMSAFLVTGLAVAACYAVASAVLLIPGAKKVL